MKNTFGTSVAVTLFGESHGEYIGAIIDGMAPGIDIDYDYIAHMLTLRRPSGKISTPRQEQDNFKIVSGICNGKTTGTPITILIPNENVKSGDYSQMRTVARPSHADFTAECKYHGFQDSRGGGHFSGRITAGLVAVGAVAIETLKNKNIHIGTHIKKCAGVEDIEFSDYNKDIDTLSDKMFAVLDDKKGEDMISAIEKVSANGDSVGGILETVVTGLPVGIGEPWFDSVESMLSHILFSIPAIKGVEFGAGFAIADMTGKEANDEFCNNGKICTVTNNAGGINGGITNGMPVIFRCAVRPTPTLGTEQNTVNIETGEDAVLKSKGRHDPCIVHRAAVVVESVTALVIADMLIGKYGTDWLVK